MCPRRQCVLVLEQPRLCVCANGQCPLASRPGPKLLVNDPEWQWPEALVSISLCWFPGSLPALGTGRSLPLVESGPAMLVTQDSGLVGAAGLSSRTPPACCWAAFSHPSLSDPCPPVEVVTAPGSLSLSCLNSHLSAQALAHWPPSGQNAAIWGLTASGEVSCPRCVWGMCRGVLQVMLEKVWAVACLPRGQRKTPVVVRVLPPSLL